MNQPESPGVLLGSLDVGETGKILSVEEDTRFTQRLQEMGLVEGSEVEIVREAPFGGDPVAIRCRGGTFALRRNEANSVRVARVDS